MRYVLTVAIACALFVALAHAVRELVIVEEPQPARTVEGVVVDPSGTPIPDMTVTDRADNCAAILRSTRTDAKGRFRFSTQPGKTVYCLRFDHPLWNPLQLKLRLDKDAPNRGITARPEIGG
jgi:protocatechuate 3,4-dioxygenase beta subunit